MFEKFENWSAVVEQWAYEHDDESVQFEEERVDNLSADEKLLNQLFDGQGWSIETIPAF